MSLLMAVGWNQMNFKVPSNPNRSMILWFYDCRAMLLGLLLNIGSHQAEVAFSTGNEQSGGKTFCNKVFLVPPSISWGLFPSRLLHLPHVGIAPLAHLLWLLRSEWHLYNACIQPDWAFLSSSSFSASCQQDQPCSLICKQYIYVDASRSLYQ